MSRTVEIALPDQLMAEVKPVLAQSKSNLDAYILEAVSWYTIWRRQNKLDIMDEGQQKLLAQIHDELAPYTVITLQTALGDEEEDWEAILAEA